MNRKQCSDSRVTCSKLICPICHGIICNLFPFMKYLPKVFCYGWAYYHYRKALLNNSILYSLQNDRGMEALLTTSDRPLHKLEAKAEKACVPAAADLAHCSTSHCNMPYSRWCRTLKIREQIIGGIENQDIWINFNPGEKVNCSFRGYAKFFHAVHWAII